MPKETGVFNSGNAAWSRTTIMRTAMSRHHERPPLQRMPGYTWVGDPERPLARGPEGPRKRISITANVMDAGGRKGGPQVRHHLRG